MKLSPRLAFAALAILVLASCGAPESVKSQDDLLFIRTSSGIAVVKAGGSAPAFASSAAVPSSDWSTVVGASIKGGMTRITAERPSNGTTRWARTLPGRFYVKAISRDGDLVALGPTREANYGRGRATTKLVIVDGAESMPLTLDLEGNFEPEAFSTDGASLFVVKYLPARAPSRYQVRMLELATGREQGVYTPDAHLQRAMGGTARIQAASSDGRRLYTLYTRRGPEHSTDQAFIHVLDLDEKWAHCIDLPEEFADSAESSTALVVSPDGRTLYVGNAPTGTVARIDTEKLAVTETNDVHFGLGGPAKAAHGPDSTVYFGSGRRVTAIETAGLTERRTWEFANQVKGVQVALESRMLYVGLKNRVAVLDPSSGTRVRSFDPPGIGTIAQFGPVMPSPPDPDRRTRGCAC
jgi:hypothetical protein